MRPVASVEARDCGGLVAGRYVVVSAAAGPAERGLLINEQDGPTGAGATCWRVRLVVGHGSCMVTSSRWRWPAGRSVDILAGGCV